MPYIPKRTWDRMVSEIDALRADCKSLAAECESWRKAWDGRDCDILGWDRSGDPRHDHKVPGVWDQSGNPCPSCRRFWMAADTRIATDASGALSRHGSTIQ